MRSVIIAILALFLCSTASADQYAVNLNFTSGLNATNGTYSGASLDLNTTARFLAVSGTLNSSAGLSSPATGTCFTTSSGGVYCNLQIDHLSVNLNIEATLSGTAELKTAVGSIISTTAVVVTSIN